MGLTSRAKQVATYMVTSFLDQPEEQAPER